MLHLILIYLSAAAFAAAGIVNAIASPAQRQSFVRWGYPAWWYRATGLLEIAIAALIAFSLTRIAGLTLGAATMAAAALTVLRHRDFSHLAPVGVYVALLLATALTA